MEVKVMQSWGMLLDVTLVELNLESPYSENLILFYNSPI